MAKCNPIAEMERFLNQKMTPSEKAEYSAALRKETMPNLTESQITQACVRWFRLEYPEYAKLLIHPANEGKRRTKVINTKYGTKVVSTGGARLKAEGLVAGASDLLLLIPRHGYGCLCIEMKRRNKKSKQSESQIEWQKAVTRVGNKYVVCRDLDEFMKEVNDYLKNN